MYPSCRLLELAHAICTCYGIYSYTPHIAIWTADRERYRGITHRHPNSGLAICTSRAISAGGALSLGTRCWHWYNFLGLLCLPYSQIFRNVLRGAHLLGLVFLGIYLWGLGCCRDFHTRAFRSHWIRYQVQGGDNNPGFLWGHCWLDYHCFDVLPPCKTPRYRGTKVSTGLVQSFVLSRYTYFRQYRTIQTIDNLIAWTIREHHTFTWWCF